ncbi:hypothetical protein PR048_022092 [Dryococelus australis]|uniref:Uncharacterized protein n=1 Tax=Dryococelus australis TaxID=614101 RepID=A0ABQ9H023_9NEOP|nr:hypothetical protein PR048_022092 [Dryococelus australis]
MRVKRDEYGAAPECRGGRNRRSLRNPPTSVTIELNYAKDDKIKLNKQTLKDISDLEKKSLVIRGFHKHKDAQQRLLAGDDGNNKMADTPVFLAGDEQTVLQT